MVYSANAVSLHPLCSASMWNPYSKASDSKLTDRRACIYTKISSITFSKIHLVTMLLRRHIRIYMCKPFCKELTIVTVCLIAYTVMLFVCVALSWLCGIVTGQTEIHLFHSDLFIEWYGCIKCNSHDFVLLVYRLGGQVRVGLWKGNLFADSTKSHL